MSVSPEKTDQLRTIFSQIVNQMGLVTALVEQLESVLDNLEDYDLVSEEQFYQNIS